jgi:hypothetical protein
VESATQDLAALMESTECKDAKERKDSSGKPKSLSLEEATRRVCGTEEVEAESASRLEGTIKAAQELLPITSKPKASPADPATVLMKVMMAAGRSAAKLLPEDRLVAQSYLSVGLEMLVAGGNLIPNHICDHLSAFVNISEVNAIRRIRVEPENLEKWQQNLASPLKSVIEALMQNELLESIQTAGLDGVVAREDARSCLMAAWRFFDPSLTRSGLEDSLRRAVNRFQRLQPAFNFAKRRSQSSVSSKGDVSSSSSEGTHCPDSESGSTSSSSSAAYVTNWFNAQGNSAMPLSGQRAVRPNEAAFQCSPQQGISASRHGATAAELKSSPPSSPDSIGSQVRLPSIGSRRGSKERKGSKPSTPPSVQSRSSFQQSPMSTAARARSVSSARSTSSFR